MSVSHSPKSGSIVVQTLGPRLISTTFSGHTNRVVAEDAWQKFRTFVATMDAPVWLSDSRSLTGFDPNTLTLGARWFSLFRERGGKDCIVVSQWPVAVMAASTMALGVGIRVRSYATLDEAKLTASSLLRGEPSVV